MLYRAVVGQVLLCVPRDQRRPAPFPMTVVRVCESNLSVKVFIRQHFPYFPETEDSHLHISQKLKIHMIYKIHIDLASTLERGVDIWVENDAGVLVPTGGISKNLIGPVRDNMRRIALGGVVGGGSRDPSSGRRGIPPVSSAGAVVLRVSYWTYLMMFGAVVRVSYWTYLMNVI